MSEPTTDDVKQRHEYARHLFQITITWYTWFIALNYGAFGWLATRLVNDGAKFNKFALWIVCILFVSHNALGIVWMIYLRKYIHNLAKDPATHGVIPDNLYARGSILLLTTLAAMLIAWLIMPFLW